MSFLLALILMLAGPECVVHEIEDYVVTSTEGVNDGSIRTAVVGSFLWVQYGHEGHENADADADDIVSWELSEDVIGATVCLDGTVTLHYAPTENASVQTIIDLVEEYAWYDPFLDSLHQPE